MTNAADADSNSLIPLFDPATDSVLVQWDGELVALNQGFPIGGDDARFLLLTDPDQDMVYEGTFTMQPTSWYQHGYIIAYGANGSFQTNGGGFDRGRRYYQYVIPTSVGPPPDLTTTWPSDFTFNTLNWKQSNLTVEPPPDLTSPTGIGDDGIVALNYDLAQNYPNPFNPTTTIKYQLPQTTDIKIAIYNINGQLVKTIVDEKQNAGNHSVVWNGRNDAGIQVATGVYLMRMKAEDFSKTRKMILIK